MSLDLFIVLDNSLEKGLLARNELFVVFLHNFGNYLGGMQGFKCEVGGEVLMNES